MNKLKHSHPNRIMSMSDPITQVQYSKKTVFLRLNDLDNYTYWDKLVMRIGASRNNSNDEPGWLLTKDKIDLFEDLLYNETRKRSRGRARRESYGSLDPKPKGSRHSKQPRDSKNEELPKTTEYDSPDSTGGSSRRHDSRDDYESEDISSEDELIQTTLARRIKSESSHKSIELEDISESDNEDCVSYARRLRHIYIVIKQQRADIEMLKKELSLALQK